MKITITSGKGGTGKTFLATNLGYIMKHELQQDIAYLDCDVEEPNAHLFLNPENTTQEQIEINSPIGIDNNKCIGCGKCSQVCVYNAITVINQKPLFFQELCHACGACSIVCPEGAINEGNRVIGKLIRGNGKGIPLHYGLVHRGEGGMTPRLIQQVKQSRGEEIVLQDSPPGTACPAVETVKGSDVCILVTDLTPFGLHDLKLSVNMCRALGIEPVVVINRSGVWKDPGIKKLL